MKIHNPIDQDVTLNYLGTEYFIGAKKTEDFPEDVANHWLTIYGFMETVTSTKEEAEEDKPKKK